MDPWAYRGPLADGKGSLSANPADPRRSPARPIVAAASFSLHPGYIISRFA